MWRRCGGFFVCALMVATPRLAAGATIETRSGKVISGEVQGRVVLRGTVGPGTEGYSHSIAYTVAGAEAITRIDPTGIGLVKGTKVVRAVRLFSGETPPDDRHTLLTVIRLLRLKQRAIGMSLWVGTGPSVGKVALTQLEVDNLTGVILGELAEASADDTPGQTPGQAELLLVVPSEEEAKARTVILQRLRVRTDSGIQEIAVTDIAGPR